MTPRQISPAGLDLIKQSESCRLTPYQDAVGVWTVGYGHTGNLGGVITQQEADRLLVLDTTAAAECVDRKCGELTQNQFDALTSFVFNVGCAAFCGSTLLRLLNAGETAAAAQQFVRWDHAGTEVLPGLLTRRERERDLFLSN